MRMPQWYVWLVGRHVDERTIPPAEGELFDGEWGVVGIFTTRDKAIAAAEPGDWIWLTSLDDKESGSEIMNVEWVEADAG